MTDTDLERRLERLRPVNLPLADAAFPASGHAIDTAQAWRDLVLRRSRLRRIHRRRLTVGAVVAAAGVGLAVPVLAGIGPLATGPAPPGTGAPSASSSPGVSRAASPPGSHAAVAVRIPVSVVGPVAQDGARAWAIGRAGASPTGRAKAQLVSIDLRSNRVVLRRNLGTAQFSVVAGGGGVWVTTSSSRWLGQIIRLDPATGHVIATLHLPADRCYLATYGAGNLWAACADGATHTALLQINPVTGRLRGTAGLVRGQIWAVTTGSNSVWFATASGVRGVIGIGGQERDVTVVDQTNTVSFAGTRSLVSGQGFIWALTSDESVAKLDPSTGRVVRIYTYRSYDPSYTAGFNDLAVGHGSLWFLNWRTGGVVRASITTGKQVGDAARVASGCNRWSCGQIYSTPGGIWVPTRNRLIRIVPGSSAG